MSDNKSEEKEAEEPFLAKPPKNINLQKGEDGNGINANQPFRDLKPSEIIRNKSKFLCVILNYFSTLEQRGNIF